MSKKTSKIDCRGCVEAMLGCWDEHPFCCKRDTKEYSPVIPHKYNLKPGEIFHGVEMAPDEISKAEKDISNCNSPLVKLNTNVKSKKFKDDLKTLLLDVEEELNHDYIHHSELINRLNMAIDKLEG